ncbi:S8 family serine peptidase [Rhizobium laguerreae]|uniref:S8 family peptidase n=1 Tax=Rhizobium laguerreae TaxID=1076926 RepID=UPI001C91399E|nr:S8 family serine peptidase [Rhizobium laguerreae]MBY3214307.1 S8 family serine peptidase [Rhizobium laguerreae]
MLARATRARPIGELEVNGGSSSGPPARYLIVKSQADLAEARQRLALILGSEPFELSSLDAESLVLEFPRRSFPLSAEGAGAAQHLGAETRDTLDALLVEPDLPRAAAPVMPDRVPGLESVDDFPPGCWVGEEADLNDRPLWALDALKIRDAWRLSQRVARPAMGSGIIIAQPDTGITGHVELAGVPLAGAFNTLGDGPANSATDPLDTGFALSPGHGSATMSVAVSRARDEADRMVGSAPLAKHMPIRALRSVWAHEELPVARAVDLAVEKGAHVITMSLGGVALPFSPLRAAIKRAVAKHVIVMAAAGNCVGIVVYPARFSECIAVGGTDQRGGKWPGSCSGPAVDISAPGQNVLRASVEPRPQGSIGQGQGTSFAVALLSGVAACWLAHHGRDRLIAEAQARGETLQTMFRRLVRATARRPAGWDASAMGAGIADAEALLMASFDLGTETESPAFELESRAPADEIRAFVTELAGADPELDDDTLLRHGSAIGAALLALRLDSTATPDLSPALAAALKGPLAARLGRALGRPAVHLTDADVLAAQSEQADRLRRSIAFGKATAAGDSIESAAGGGATALPDAAELSARLDQLLAQPDDRGPTERTEFERAVELIRLHGTRGIEKLTNPRSVMLPAELAAAEAVIKADGSRPSFLIRNGKIDPKDPFAGSWGDRLLALRDDIETRAAMCGRIQPTHGHANRYCGTGALVDPSGPWVLSNFHVIQQALRSYPLFQFPTERGLRITGGLEIDFAAETDTTITDRWTIDEAVFPNGAGEGFGYIDAVLLRLGRSLDNKPLPPGGPGHSNDRFAFSPTQGFVTGEMPVLALIGFPNRPPQSSGMEGGIDWGWVVGQLFGGRFGVKRLAPGEFYRTVGSHPRDAETRYTFGYDATTMKGSSGSPAFSVSEAQSPAFGLHFAGYDNDSNFALTTAALQRGFEGRGVAFP